MTVVFPLLYSSTAIIDPPENPPVAIPLSPGPVPLKFALACAIGEVVDQPVPFHSSVVVTVVGVELYPPLFQAKSELVAPTCKSYLASFIGEVLVQTLPSYSSEVD